MSGACMVSVSSVLTCYKGWDGLCLYILLLDSTSRQLRLRCEGDNWQVITSRRCVHSLSSRTLAPTRRTAPMAVGCVRMFCVCFCACLWPFQPLRNCLERYNVMDVILYTMYSASWALPVQTTFNDLDLILGVTAETDSGNWNYYFS